MKCQICDTDNTKKECLHYNKVMNTTENNRLIAEFLNWQYTEETETNFALFYFRDNGYTIGALKFHTDWDWLMEVVEKIKSIGYFIDMSYLSDHGYIHNSIAFNYATYSTVVCNVSSIPNPSQSYPPTAENPMYISEFNDPKEALYNLIIRFIKWYNKEQKK
jgi:hypothetical protein